MSHGAGHTQTDYVSNILALHTLRLASRTRHPLTRGTHPRSFEHTQQSALVSSLPAGPTLLKGGKVSYANLATLSCVIMSVHEMHKFSATTLPDPAEPFCSVNDLADLSAQYSICK
jgi:hypothetical protein